MELFDLKEVSNNINIDEYLYLYNYVRDNMEHPEWLGTFTKEEIEEILKIGGKIWMYYDKETPVCSVFIFHHQTSLYKSIILIMMKKILEV